MGEIKGPGMDGPFVMIVVNPDILLGSVAKKKKFFSGYSVSTGTIELGNRIRLDHISEKEVGKPTKRNGLIEQA